MASAGPYTPSSAHSGPFPPAPTAPDTPTSVSPVQQPFGANASKNQASHTRHISFDPGLPSPAAAHTPKLPAFKLGPRLSPPPLTGRAAMADERRLREQRERETSRQISPNPAISALTSLLGVNDMTKARDAPPAATTLSEPLAQAAKKISIPDSGTGGENMQTSPVSVSSFGSLDSTTAPTATAGATDTAPAGHFGAGGMPVADAPSNGGAPAHHGPSPGDGFGQASRSQTFPAPAPAELDPRAPARVLSMPMSGYNQNSSPRSPNTKRHKCPYCSTDFTRHHNLKSHLLTHSQEKPYECPTCQARFRRLHDLKRHTKLHTGERPHTCPKCGRKFARGDALARHNKGQGGCAGRRSSFGMDDDGDGKGEDGMDGLVYHGGDAADDDRMDEDGPGGRRVSEPSKGRQGSHSSYHQHSSTYPPIAGRGMSGSSVRGSMFPPGTGTGGSGPSRDPSGHPSPKAVGSSLSSMHYPGQTPSVFAQGSMTESPKPISPGQMEPQHRQGAIEGASVPGGRSPSMSGPAHPQQQYQSGAGTGSSPMGLRPPVANSHAPQLPSLPGLSSNIRMPIENKLGAQGAKQNAQASHALGPSMLQQQVSGPGSASTVGSLSSHGQSSGGSMREYFGGRETDIWSYLRDIEARMTQAQEESNRRIAGLQDEVAQLRAQLQQHQQHQQQQQQAPQSR
ncbi:uncharacterized protein K452DRAFT_228127 [Aplosporella prunicola CBS 121167]|uniref:C2H2-type domain-containing protein n=1 Tax=Aplosporella prunicola CBS 121167 TaxID=1176127 RepID=A0A6A6BEI8_9PEZI|nr:uncharacterized protein K452DRAFT_228127 [Aplosporella prunicola CBS 121167]KAF2141725.1 hypothetical protein K452DRAFT_228127 [Aplosporella prunicola CBS 121167]